MKIRSVNLKFISVLTSIMILLSSFTIFNGLALKTEAAENIEIMSFGVSLSDGASLVSGQYVYTPKYSDAGHQYIFRVNYSLSGEGFFDPGEVEIRIPRHIIRNREGVYADECELSIPSRTEIEEYEGDLSEIDASFVYEYDGDEIVITNFRGGNERLKAGSTGDIDIGYRMTQQTYYYRDMSPSENFTAELKIFGEGHNVIASAQGEAEEVYMDTSATLVSTTKRCLNLVSPYSSWQNSWGEQPESSGDYYYLVWELRSYISDVTQPYKFVIDDVVSEADAEPVAYKLWGTNSFGSLNYQENLTAERFVRYDYVITRHLKATYKPLDSYNITNTETASLISKDNVDPVQSVSSTDVFSYVKTGYSGPGGYFSHRKWGNNNWHYRFNYRWEIADYGLQDLRDRKVDYLNGNIKFFVEGISYSYRWTLEDGADVGDLSEYGKRNVTSVLTDDSFYLNDAIEQTEDHQIVIGENERKLTYQDFSVDYVNYDVIIRDGKYNEQDGDFVSVSARYKNTDIIYFYGKFGDSDQWIQVGSFNKYTNTADFDSTYVVSLTDSRIVFAENCVGYRIESSNPHYSTVINAYPYCRIKNSDYVMEQAGDESVEKIWLTDVSDFEVRDSHGELLHQSRSMARDYIVGVEKENELEKSVITTRSSPIKRTVTVGWKVVMSEYYISNYGIVYIHQDTGTFFDLLPKGCAVDDSTVSVSTGEGDYSFLDGSDYKVTVIDNYNNSGRTMLKVLVKKQFSRAILTYNTVSSWDSIVEYGTAMHNSVAYETGNESITGGQNDTGGDIRDSEYMSGLDSQSSGNRFIYTEHDSNLRFLVASFTGLYKKVKSVNDTLFTEEANVRQNSLYTYKLRYSTSTISRAKDIILYDSLENFCFEGSSSDWHGSVVYVDVGQAEDMGIAPVVYYSSEDSMKIEDHNDLEEVINGERVWKTADEFGDVSAAKAIAVDLRHDKNGDDFVLDYRSAVSVNVYMRSPQEDKSNSDDPVCYNNVYMKNTVIDLLDNEVPFFIHQDNTFVHLRVAGDLYIEKRGSEQGNPAIAGIEFTLEGVSFYNTEIKLTQKSDQYGHIEFENIEKGQNYILYESSGSDDYLPIDHVYAVSVDDSGNVTVDGHPVASGEYYNITDDPRVHTDIEFFKRDISQKNKLLSGVTFLLSGRSVYGTKISIRSTSEENGKVTFRNIEKGSDYTLTEYATIDGYIKSVAQYKVKVDDNAHFFITSDDDTYFTADTELNGTISIYNEPYHRFEIQKEGTIKIDGEALPVRGAEYRFWGTSDYGTDYDITKTTQANGRLHFDDLEAGIYHLKETAAPEGYELDTTEYMVEITPTDEITIKGGDKVVSRNNMGHYVFTDNEKGTIVITKKWLDTPDSLAQRLADGTTPVIHLSTDPKKSEAYFKDSAILSTVAGSKGNVLHFKPFTGDDEEVAELISNGTAKRIDDRTTEFKIYGWYISDETADDYKTVYWWSDAKNVYIKPNAYNIWKEADKILSIDVSGINSSKMTSMASMFYNCNQLQSLVGLDSFDTSNVTSFEGMFNRCYALNVLEGYENWDTSQATSMNSMFRLCRALPYLDLSNWNTSNVESMAYMFSANSYDDPYLIQPMSLEYITFGSGFDTSNVKDMKQMFYGCRNITGLDLSGFNTSNVTKMSSMFQDCTSLASLDLSSFNTEKVTDMSYMFSGCAYPGAETKMELETLTLSSQFLVPEVTSFECMFYNCYKLKSLDLSPFVPEKVTTMRKMFSGCYSLNPLIFSDNFNTENVTSMASMFENCTSLSEINLNRFNVGKVKDMENMFKGCTTIKSLDLSGFDMSSVEQMTCMFYQAGQNTFTKYGQEFTINFGTDFDIRKVGSLQGVFAHCGAVVLDVSPFITSENLKSMVSMFNGCARLENVNFIKPDGTSTFNTSGVTNMMSAFYTCGKIKVLDLSCFDTSNVTNMNGMFVQNWNIQTIYVSALWSTESLTDAGVMFQQCVNENTGTALTGGQGTRLKNYGLEDGKPYAHIDGGTANPGYFTERPVPATTGSGARTVTKIRTTSASAGTAYVSTDDNCTITVLSEDIWEYTFTSIPPNMQFYTWEDTLKGYTSENMGEVKNKEVVDGRATIVNVAEGYDIPDKHFGSLVVNKLVVKADGSELTEEQAAKRFSFNLRLFDINGDPVTETLLLGSVAYGRNGASFNLAHDESLTISGIPAGYSYRVTETAESGYTSQVSSGEAYGVIPQDDTVSVTYTNTLVDEKLMSFRLEKKVNGNYENTDEEFSFLISLTGLQSGKTYSITGDVNRTFTAEPQEITQIDLALRQNESVSIELPVGAKYMVTELGGEYTSAYKITDPSNIPAGILQSSGSTMNRKNTSLSTALETADEGESVTVTFTNTKDVRQDLTLIKKVENTASSEPFEFTADFIGLTPLETIDLNIYDLSGAQLTAFREAADSNGRIEGLRFYLTGDEKIVFGQLPVGTRYRISEAASSYRASYRIIASADSSELESKENDLVQKSLTTGTADQNGAYTDEGMNVIHEGSDIEVTYTNTKLSHDVTISKLADFTYSNLTYSERTSIEFAFAVSISGLTPESSYTMSYTDKNTTGIIKEEEFTADGDGNASPEITLKSGMSCRIIDLPEGAVYTVSENACKMFVAEYSIEGNSGSVIAKTGDRNLLTNTELSTAQERVDINDNDIVITFMNTYSASDYVLPASGSSGVGIMTFSAAAGMLIFGSMFMLCRKKRKTSVK